MCCTYELGGGIKSKPCFLSTTPNKNFRGGIKSAWIIYNLVTVPAYKKWLDFNKLNHHLALPLRYLNHPPPVSLAPPPRPPRSIHHRRRLFCHRTWGSRAPRIASRRASRPTCWPPHLPCGCASLLGSRCMRLVFCPSYCLISSFSFFLSFSFSLS